MGSFEPQFFHSSRSPDSRAFLLKRRNFELRKLRLYHFSHSNEYTHGFVTDITNKELQHELPNRFWSGQSEDFDHMMDILAQSSIYIYIYIYIQLCVEQ